MFMLRRGYPLEIFSFIALCYFVICGTVAWAGKRAGMSPHLAQR